MKYDHIIWDFNGTILDDVEVCVRSVNTLLGERGLPTLDGKETYRRVFGFPIKEYYERLGFDFEREPYEVVAPLWVEQYLLNVRDAVVFPDIREAIETLEARGAKQTLLSATELQMLKGQLCELGLFDSFGEVLGREDIHAASKEGIARLWRSAHPNARVLMIGDTDHDLQVAKAIGADCALVCRGHQSGEYLSTLGAPVYTSVRELMAALDDRL